MFPSLKTGVESPGVGAAFLQERKIQSLIKENIVHCKKLGGNVLDYYSGLQDDVKAACLAADAQPLLPNKGGGNLKKRFRMDLPDGQRDPPQQPKSKK